MSADITIQGHIAEPRINTTSSGKRVVELFINGTNRKKTDTGDWIDDGGQLWVKAAFWERDADKVRRLVKGDLVAVTGTLIVDEYQGKNGPGTSLVIKFPRFLGVVPRMEQTANPANTFGHALPTQPQQSFNDAPPF